jgi:hypothetical protein
MVLEMPKSFILLTILENHDLILWEEEGRRGRTHAVCTGTLSIAAQLWWEGGTELENLS